LIGGLLMHGLTPGPMLFLHHPEFVYGLYSSLVIANLAQLPVGLLVLVPCIWLVNRPQPWLISGILALIVSGAYCIQGSTSDLWIVLIAGVAGYVMRKLDVPILPFVLGVVLGYLVESNYRRSLLISNGDHTIFLQDPLSAVFLIIAALIVGLSLTAELRTARRSRG
jgi:putative tricarboxylic transport membrane protein